MRYAWTGFHILMLVLVIAAFSGAFSAKPTGSLTRDAGSNVTAVIGVITIWVIGTVIFRFARRFSKY